MNLAKHAGALTEDELLAEVGELMADKAALEDIVKSYEDWLEELRNLIYDLSRCVNRQLS